jgi:plasmid stabilization system protein ParE
MRSARFHPEAEREVVAHEAWYRERSEVAAQGFLLELDHAITEVVDAPERWPLGKRGERRYVFPRYPFNLLYRVRGDEIFITAVAHQSRRPGVLAPPQVGTVQLIHAAVDAAQLRPGSRAAWSSVNLDVHGFGTRDWPRS